MARGAPTSASKVRWINGSRAWVSTWMVTSSGMRSSSMSLRTKSNSICDAEGKPTSISLKPIFTSCSNMRILRAMSMGSIRAWLPSRRSTLHQMGALVITASGQERSVRRTGAAGRYLMAGLCNIGALSFRWNKETNPACAPATPRKTKTARRWCSRAVEVGVYARATLCLPVGQVK